MGEKVRLHYLDALKTLLMFSVVLGHTMQFYYQPLHTEVPMWRFTHSINMPLFMMISGYLSYKVGPQQFTKNFFLKIFRGILLPFIAWAFVAPVFMTGNIDLDSSFHALKYPDAGLWFLYNLFVYRVIFKITEHLEGFKRVKIKQEIWLLCFYICFLFLMFQFGTLLNFAQICWHLPYFALGYYVKKYKFDNLSKKSSLIFGFFFLTCIGLYALNVSLMSPIFNSYALGRLYSYFMSMNGALFCFYVGKFLLNKKAAFFNYISKLTLGMYAFNYAAIHYATITLPVFDIAAITILSRWILASSIAIALTIITRRIPVVRLFLLGMK